MVANPGAPGGDRRVRPLNLPRPVDVLVDEEGRPLLVKLPDHDPEPVIDLLKSWRIDEGWWQERQVSRIYWQCILENGRFLTVYQDLVDGTWWRQRA